MQDEIQDKKKKNRLLRWMKRSLLWFFMPLSFLLIMAIAAIYYKLPEIANAMIADKIKQYEFEDFEIEMRSISLDRAVAGSLVIGPEGDQLSIDSLVFHYDIESLQQEKINKLELIGVNLRLTMDQGQWHLAGLDSLKRTIAQIKKRSNEDAAAKDSIDLPQIEIKSSLLTIVHHGQWEQIPFEISIASGSSDNLDLKIQAFALGANFKDLHLAINIKNGVCKLELEECLLPLDNISPFLLQVESPLKRLGGQLSLSQLKLSLVDFKDWQKQLDIAASIHLKKLSGQIEDTGDLTEFELQELMPQQISWQIKQGSFQPEVTYEASGLTVRQDDKFVACESLSGQFSASLKSFVIENFSLQQKLKGLSLKTEAYSLLAREELLLQLQSNEKNELQQMILNGQLDSVEYNNKLFKEVDFKLNLLAQKAGLEIQGAQIEDLNLGLKASIFGQVELQSKDNFLKDFSIDSYRASVNVTQLAHAKFSIKPFSLEAHDKPQDVIFSTSKLAIDLLPHAQLEELRGQLDLQVKKVQLDYLNKLNLQSWWPQVEGQLKPIETRLILEDSQGFVKFSLSNNLPSSKVELKSDLAKLSGSLSLQSSFYGKIDKQNVGASRLEKLTTELKFNDINFSSPKAKLKKASLKILSSLAEPYAFTDKKPLQFTGKMSGTLDELNLEGFALKDLKLSLPFYWSSNKMFLASEGELDLAKLSAAGLDFNELALKPKVLGLQLSFDEKIWAGEHLEIDLQHKMGWEIPTAVLAAEQSMVTYLAKLVLQPDYNFVSSSLFAIKEGDISEALQFFNVPTKGWQAQGKFSTKGEFHLDRRGMRFPMRLNLKNVDLQRTGEDGLSYELEGVKGEINLKSVLDLESVDKQRLSISSIEFPGLSLNNTKLIYKLKSAQLLELNQLRTTWCGGLLETDNLSIDFTKNKRDFVVHASDVEVSEVLKLIKGVDAEANGKLYGRCRLKLSDGLLVSQQGFLITEPAVPIRLKVGVDSVIYRYLENKLLDSKSVRKLLSDLDVEYFKLHFSGDTHETQKTTMQLAGHSIDKKITAPLKLEMNFNGPMIYLLQKINKERLKDSIQQKFKKGKK